MVASGGAVALYLYAPSSAFPSRTGEILDVGSCGLGNTMSHGHGAYGDRSRSVSAKA